MHEESVSEKWIRFAAERSRAADTTLFAEVDPATLQKWGWQPSARMSQVKARPAVVCSFFICAQSLVDELHDRIMCEGMIFSNPPQWIPRLQQRQDGRIVKLGTRKGSGSTGLDNCRNSSDLHHAGARILPPIQPGHRPETKSRESDSENRCSVRLKPVQKGWSLHKQPFGDEASISS